MSAVEHFDDRRDQAFTCPRSAPRPCRCHRHRSTWMPGNQRMELTPTSEMPQRSISLRNPLPGALQCPSLEPRVAFQASPRLSTFLDGLQHRLRRAAARAPPQPFVAGSNPKARPRRGIQWMGLAVAPTGNLGLVLRLGVGRSSRRPLMGADHVATGVCTLSITPPPLTPRPLAPALPDHFEGRSTTHRSPTARRTARYSAIAARNDRSPLHCARRTALPESGTTMIVSPQTVSC
jgi:hypothetical protein